MQANNTQEGTSQSHWLNIVESAAVFAAVGGSITAVFLEQIALASIPLSLTAVLNLANRRRQMSEVQEQQRLEIAHVIQLSQDDTHSNLEAMQKTTEKVQSQIEQLMQQETQSSQTIKTLTEQTEDFTTDIAALQAHQTEGESTFSTLSEQSQTAKTHIDDLSTQVTGLQDQIAQLQSSASELNSRVDAQRNSSQSLAAQTEGVGELVDTLREIDTLTQAISVNPNVAQNFYQRGLARKRLERLEDQRIAIEDFSQALALEPDFANAYFERGLLKSEVGHKQHAVDDLRMAAKFYFDQSDLAKYETARNLSQEIHAVIAGSPTPEQETEQYLIENLFD